MKKLKNILTSVFMLVMASVIMVGCGNNNPGNGGNSDTTSQNQLAQVTNIQYVDSLYKFTWNSVENADSYNIKVNGNNIEGIKLTEYEFYPQSGNVVKIQVQAVSNGNYDNSKWSNEYSHTLQLEESVLTNIMNYAKDNINGTLKKFVSASTYIDRYSSKILVMKVISFLDGKDLLTTITAEIDNKVDTSSLNNIVKSNLTLIASEDKILAVDNNGKVINSMTNLLASNKITSTNLHKNYLSKGYGVEIVSSYTSIDSEYDTKGKDFTIHGVLKLTRDKDIKYVLVECGCSLQNPTDSLTNNVTEGLNKNPSLYEADPIEIQGDFVETSLQVRNVNK